MPDENEKRPDLPGTQPAVSSPDAPSSPRIDPFQRPSEAEVLAWYVCRIVREEMPRLWRRAAERIIESEPAYPQNVWQELGFWGALKLTVWMVCHPYKNVRMTVGTVKRKLLWRLGSREFEHEAWRVYANQPNWQADVLLECEARLAHLQRELEAYRELAMKEARLNPHCFAMIYPPVGKAQE